MKEVGIDNRTAPVVLCLDAQYATPLPLNKEPGVLTSLALALRVQVPALLGVNSTIVRGEEVG